MNDLPLSRREFFKGGNTSRPDLDRLNLKWPTKRVAKIIRKNLKKIPPIYHPPKVDEHPPVLPVTNSIQSLQDVDWDMGAAKHLLCRTMFGPKYPEIKVFAINTEKPNKIRTRDFFRSVGVTTLNTFYDPDLSLVKTFKLRGLPTSILINKDGKEFGRVIGEVDFASEDFLNLMKKYI